MSAPPATAANGLLSPRRHSRFAIFAAALLGVACPAIYGWCVGVREPRIHDEYSYLLAAETFARGRLTNPAPDFPEFFESEHILIVPTYMSKYPPGQGFCLAAGQVLFGHPVWGVWMTCGAFAGSLCWMLQGWTSRRWALATTLVVILILGVSKSWAQSYWGGMLAATGGALLFGGLRYSLRQPGAGAGWLMGSGIFILAISRPFEGVFVCLAVAAVIGWRVLLDHSVPRRVQVLHRVLPVSVMSVASLATLATCNHAVTGNWRQFPHALQHRQYFHQGLFCFNGTQQPERVPCARISRYYVGHQTDVQTDQRLVHEMARNLFERTIRFFAFAATRQTDITRSMGGTLATIAAISALLAAGRRNRWMHFCWGTLGLALAADATVRRWQPHYSAPVLPLVYAAFADSLRRITLACGARRRATSWAPAAVVGVVAAWSLANDGVACTRKLMERLRSEPTIGNRAGALLTRGDVVRELLRVPGDDLVFVRYENDFDVHQEWVYNGADLQTAPVIFAHDLGPEKNRRLVEHYPGRRVWNVALSAESKTLTPHAEPRISTGDAAPRE